MKIYNITIYGSVDSIIHCANIEVKAVNIKEAMDHADHILDLMTHSSRTRKLVLNSIQGE